MTHTKIFVGGLAWITREEGLRNFFQQFGEIVHVNIVYDRQTTRSKGYGFVTFKDVESANRACADPYPMIDGRRANCNLASNGHIINQNHSKQTGFAHDDLCYFAPSYWQNQSIYFDPNRNEYYNQQYIRLWDYYMQHKIPYTQQHNPK